MTCDGTVQWQVKVDGPAAHLGIEVEAPSAHCSKVAYTISTAADVPLGTSRALGGG